VYNKIDAARVAIACAAPSIRGAGRGTKEKALAVLWVGGRWEGEEKTQKQNNIPPETNRAGIVRGREKT